MIAMALASVSLSLSLSLQVFSPDVMEAFLSRTVIPKLVYCLQSLVINPQNENIGL